jgi:hypothetical protein
VANWSLWRAMLLVLLLVGLGASAAATRAEQTPGPGQPGAGGEAAPTAPGAGPGGGAAARSTDGRLTMTIDDVPPGYDEGFLVFHDFPFGPLRGDLEISFFSRGTRSGNPAFIMDVALAARGFETLTALSPADARAMHQAATIEGFMEAGSAFAVMRESFQSADQALIETVREGWAEAQPPILAPGGWAVMDTYRYQRAAARGDGAVATMGRGDVVHALVVESQDGRAADVLRDYIRLLDGRGAP